jgi:hypothetical protein
MFQIYYPGITHCRYLLFAQVARRVGGVKLGMNRIRRPNGNRPKRIGL